MKDLALCGLALLALTSCGTTVGLANPDEIPPSAVDTCTAQCEAIGLEFDGVNLEGREVGCLCEPD